MGHVDETSSINVKVLAFAEMIISMYFALKLFIRIWKSLRLESSTNEWILWSDGMGMYPFELSRNERRLKL